MKISVTQEDIEQGQRENCNYCPVALAIKRVVKPWDMAVGTSTCGINAHSYTLPTVAMMFIDSFDKGLPVQPFEFELPIAA